MINNLNIRENGSCRYTLGKKSPVRLSGFYFDGNAFQLCVHCTGGTVHRDDKPISQTLTELYANGMHVRNRAVSCV